MIIDEGFLSNAKKIAETQPQQSEVRVPEIKRENYTDYVQFKIYYESDKENIKKYFYRMTKLQIFMENGEITESTDHNFLTMRIEADLLWTVENIYEFCKYIEKMIKNISKIYTAEIEINEYVYKIKYPGIDFNKSTIDKDRIYLTNALVKKFYVQQCKTTLQMFIGLMRNNFGKEACRVISANWLNRNDCSIIPSEYIDKKVLFHSVIPDIHEFLTELVDESLMQIRHKEGTDRKITEYEAASSFFEINRFYIADINIFHTKPVNTEELYNKYTDMMSTFIPDEYKSVYDMFKGTEGEAEVNIYKSPTDDTMEIYMDRMLRTEKEYYVISFLISRYKFPKIFNKVKECLRKHIESFDDYMSPETTNTIKI